MPDSPPATTSPATRTPGTFQDSRNRLWAINVSYGLARRVKQSTGVDVLKITDPQSAEFQKAVADPYLLYDMLAAALAPQLTDANISADDLADSLTTEDQAQNAYLALFEGVINFTQPAKAQVLLATLKRALGIAQESQDQAVQTLQAALNSGELDEELRAAMTTPQTTTPGGKDLN